jgi:succinoglycan biosynthesis transport protein ExoP
MEELSLADYLAILKRCRKYFLATFFVLWGISLALAFSWSNYRSTAMVEVERPQVAPTMTSPIGMNAGDMPESLADLRISRIEQKVTSPASLVDIIGKYNLYGNARERERMESIAKRMGNKIKLALIGSTIANSAATQKVSVDQLSAIAFTLSFDYSDPLTAQQVTKELVARFLDEDLKDRRAQAEATSAFLQAQITELESSLAEQEKNIAKFEGEHGVTRPETLMFNQQAAATATLTLQGLDAQIASNEGTQGSLRAQLASIDPYTRVIADGQVLTTPAIQLKALEAQYTTLTAQYGPQHPDVVRVGHQIDALRRQIGNVGGDSAGLRAQIQDVKTNLEAARKNYGPDHPDVVSLRHQLDSLEKQLASAKTGSAHSLKQDADNPAYLAFVEQLHSVEEQYKSLQDQRKALVEQQQKYEQVVLQNPAMQQQMEILSRDHDNAELRYRELKEKKMSADMDVQMIADRKGERLVVISPPDLPLTTYPKRIFLFLGGFLLAFVGGLGSVVVANAINQNIFGPMRVEALTGVAPLAVIPHLYTEKEKTRTRRLQFGAGSFGLFKNASNRT